MTTRDERLAEFKAVADYPAGEQVRLLCEDHVGTYALPFPCVEQDRIWKNARTGEAIEADVIGWRTYSEGR